MKKPWIHEVYESADLICEHVMVKHGGRDVVVAWWSTGCGIDSCPSTTVLYNHKRLSDQELADLYEDALKKAKKNRDKVLAGETLSDDDTIVER